MVRDRGRRTPWIVFLTFIIPAGVLSRMVRTGSVLFDKYLGDVLYAAMIYAILRFWVAARVAAVAASVLMVVIELFQLTSIAAQMVRSEHLLLRVVARLMGTHFSYLDLVAYAVGIGCVYAADRARKL